MRVEHVLRRARINRAKGTRRRAGRLERLALSLRAGDPDIIEIVQFGSSVYAPRLARDVDLVVTTRARKDEDVYWNATASWDRQVDILVREPGQRMSQQMALSVLAFGKTLYGKGVTRREAKDFMGVPTYDDARMYLTMADRNLTQAHEEQSERFRDAHSRLAFDLLFDAARYAVMTFLATDEKRWGRLAGRLPSPLSTRFREFIGVLHVQYSYDDLFPRDRVEEEFAAWRGKVSTFIEEVAAR